VLKRIDDRGKEWVPKRQSDSQSARSKRRCWRLQMNISRKLLGDNASLHMGLEATRSDVRGIPGTRFPWLSLLR
jgi:hypothetical protein